MTPYENVTDRFIRKIKQDKEYFCINGVTEEEEYRGKCHVCHYYEFML